MSLENLGIKKFSIDGLVWEWAYIGLDCLSI